MQLETKFLLSVARPNGFPAEGLPETAMIGRSNCGKSSLLNAITGTRGLARVSKTPGATRMVNFFQVTGRGLLVDLPGFGYAKTSKDEREHWQPLADLYFSRQSLQQILFLHDCRRDFTAEDLEFMAFLGEHRKLVLVLTKIDKLSRRELEVQRQKLLAALASRNLSPSAVFSTSTLKKLGITELRENLFPNPPAKD